jgi:LacI family transcriptional regulator
MSTIKMKDIAEKVGISRQAVSAILNNRQCFVSDSTRQKVLKLVEELNYQPNYFAKSLKGGKTNIISVTAITPTTMFNQYYPGLVYKGIGDFFKEKNYKLLFQDVSDLKKKEHCLELAGSNLVDGVIFLLFTRDIEVFQDIMIGLLQKLEIPFVVIHSFRSGFDCPNVGVDCIHGGRIAADHLLEHGYDTIGFVKDARLLPYSEDLYTGYTQALQSRGRSVNEDHLYSVSSWLAPGGYELADKMLAEKRKLPRSFIVFNDTIAHGMIARFTEAGLRVPEDIALMAFGDLINRDYIPHQLSCVTQPAQ